MKEQIEGAIEYARKIKELAEDYERFVSETDGIIYPTIPSEVHLTDTAFGEFIPENMASEEEVYATKYHQKWAYAIIDGVKVFTCASKEEIYG